jgi:MFS family permease
LIIADEKGLPEKLVAFLFVVGFLSGGISASFVGSFADRCGRRSACLVYCIVYSLSCLTLLSDHIAVLFLGRVLGGVSGTMLYSVFESWLVSEYNKLDLDDSGAALTRIFSNLTTLNSLVAIVAGVFAGWLVNMTGTAKTPFIASIACLAIASTAILCYWVCKDALIHDQS